jgi:6-phosphogluconolactonase
MRIEAFPAPEAAAAAAAGTIASAAQTAVHDRGRFLFAVSGGHTPWIMLQALATEPVPWDAVHVFQVDERVAPDGDPARNLTHLKQALFDRCKLRPDHIHAMPVTVANLDVACEQYADALRACAGTPPVLDLIHLGLGPDGHTASLVPWDPVLDVDDRDVALTEPYEGRRRMTLTYPVLNRARSILWLVTGEEKAGMLTQLVQGDRSIPAGRVAQNQAIVIADRGAAMQLAPHDVATIG